MERKTPPEIKAWLSDVIDRAIFMTYGPKNFDELSFPLISNTTTVFDEELEVRDFESVDQPDSGHPNEDQDDCVDDDDDDDDEWGHNVAADSILDD